MGQVLHGSATTTEAVRRAIQARQESVRALAKRFGISPTTVQKWRKRQTTADGRMGPKEPRSTVLTLEEEAIVVAFRRHTLLPLDDCLYALQPTIPHLRRSSLHCRFRGAAPMSSDKIGPQHRSRKAVLYVRQSSAHQRNRESQLLQYAMRDRVVLLGWSEIEVVDEDLGCSAAGGTTRAGFERMVAEVCLSKVGAVAAREVSRFARNSRDWQQLVEMGRAADTLLIDQEAVYAPRQGNDRLLLGLKGSLNEYELDLLRQRRLRRVTRKRVGANSSSQRRSASSRWANGSRWIPTGASRPAIKLAIDKVAELGSVRQALFWFLDHKLDLPTRIHGGAVECAVPAIRRCTGSSPIPLWWRLRLWQIRRLGEL